MFRVILKSKIKIDRVINNFFLSFAIKISPYKPLKKRNIGVRPKITKELAPGRKNLLLRKRTISPEKTELIIAKARAKANRNVPACVTAFSALSVS